MRDVRVLLIHAVVSGLVQQYVELGLRLGRHNPDIVDAYYGPGQWRDAIAAEPVHPAGALVADARRLLADIDASVEPDIASRRRRWIRAQLEGVCTVARVLDGEDIAYLDEVEACFGVRPELVTEDEIAAAHRELDTALGGTGPLADRMAAMRDRHVIPIDRLPAVTGNLLDELRSLTSAAFGLPEGEHVDFELVSDKPWSGFNHYLGGLHSRVAINTDVPVLSSSIAHLVAHEAYPGHHTEHVHKEVGLVRGRHQMEEAIFLIGTPSCLMAEGLADLGLEALLGSEPHEAVGTMVRAAGAHFELESVRALSHFGDVSGRARGLLAVQLHDEGVDADTVIANAERWLLLDHHRAIQVVRFLNDPTWRAYVFCYAEGYRRCRDFVAGEPERFARLLDEQLLPADLS